MSMVRTLMAWMVAALAAPSFAAELPLDSLRGLIAQHRCEIADRLARIHAVVGLSSPDNGFIVVSLPAHPHGYVQCIFSDDRTRMLCEAASGFYHDLPQVPRTFHLAPAAIAALARLGFDTDDSKGNFQSEFAIGLEPDFNAVAELMLTALHDGYGARAGDRLRVDAPLAPQPGAKCAPIG